MDNASSAPGASIPPDSTDFITTAHLSLIAILAVLTILAILYGIRLKRQRTIAEKELEEYNEEVEEKQDGAVPPAAAEAAPSPPPPSPAAPPPPPPPAGPAPSRLDDEPVVANAPGTASPAAEAQPEPARPAEAPGNPADGPVTQLKGLGPKLATKLEEQGITTIGQIAALDDDQARALDAELGPFAGRMARDRWIEQARFLAAGDRKGFEAVFGRL